jgi:hypothetical protein
MGVRVEVGPERIVLTDGLQPFMVRSASGAIWVMAQTTAPPGFVLPPRNAMALVPGYVVSRDGGRTWRRWQTLAMKDATVGPGELGLQETRFRLGMPMFEGAAMALCDGTVLLMEWIADGPDEAGNFTAHVWESHDDLETFAGPYPSIIPLPQAKIGYDDCGHPYTGVTFHRTLLELPGGDLLATVYCWFKGDDTPCPYQPNMKKFRCILLRSYDRARSWRYISTIAVDHDVGEEGFNEPVMARMTKGKHPGRLLCLMRTGSNDCPVYQCHSDDEGATWSLPRPLVVNGVDPDLVEAADGTLVGVVGRRDWKNQLEKCCYQLIVSEDGGESWHIAADWRWEPHSGIERTTSYSAIVEVEPGCLLVLYDIGAWGEPVRYIGAREVWVAPDSV